MDWSGGRPDPVSTGKGRTHLLRYFFPGRPGALHRRAHTTISGCPAAQHAQDIVWPSNPRTTSSFTDPTGLQPGASPRTGAYDAGATSPPWETGSSSTAPGTATWRLYSMALTGRMCRGSQLPGGTTVGAFPIPRGAGSSPGQLPASEEGAGGTTSGCWGGSDPSQRGGPLRGDGDRRLQQGAPSRQNRRRDFAPFGTPTAPGFNLPAPTPTTTGRDSTFLIDDDGSNMSGSQPIPIDGLPIQLAARALMVFASTGTGASWGDERLQFSRWGEELPGSERPGTLSPTRVMT